LTGFGPAVVLGGFGAAGILTGGLDVAALVLPPLAEGDASFLLASFADSIVSYFCTLVALQTFKNFLPFDTILFNP
jgi:hypothetical protein